MANQPTYQMYAQDFDMQTSFFSNEEIGVYIRLLNVCWIHNGLPTNTELLARICRISEVDFLKIWSVIKNCFFEKDGKIFNEMQENTRRFFVSKSENGKKGGRGNKSNDLKPKSNLNQKQNENLLLYEVEDEDENEVFEKGAEKTFFAENVSMTNAEYSALIQNHGNEVVNWSIEKLNNYKLSTGKNYKSDYRAILSWVLNEFKKQNQNGSNQSKPTEKPFIGRMSRETVEKNLQGWGDL